jgi:cold shock CspA family protein
MHGTVLFWKSHEDKSGGGFGFIVPDGGGANSRAANYWFGPKSLAGLTVRSGDRVEFDAGNFRPGKGPQAAHVRLRDDREEITTLQGEFET